MPSRHLILADFDGPDVSFPAEVATLLPEAHFVALSPAADAWGAAHGIAARLPDEFMDHAILNQQALANFAFLEQFHQDLDAACVQAGLPPLLSGNRYRNKIFLDAFAMRELLLQAIFREFTGGQVHYLAGAASSGDLQRLIWKNDGSVYDHLLLAWPGPTPAVHHRIAHAPTPPSAQPRLPRAVLFKLFAVVGKRRLRRLPSLLSSFLSHPGKADGEVLFLKDHLELEELWLQHLKGRDISPAWLTIKDDGTPKAQALFTDLRGRTVESLSLSGVPCDGLETLANTAQQLLDRHWPNGIPLTKGMFVRTIRTQLDELPKLEAVFVGFADYFRRHPRIQVLSTSVSDPVRHAACLAARDAGVPVNLVQHGAFAFGVNHLFKWIDLQPADRYLFYGRETQRLMLSRLRPVSLAPARCFPVGSFAIHKLIRENRHVRVRPRPKLAVYASNVLDGNGRYVTNYDFYSDVAHWRLQRDIIDMFISRPDWHLVFRPHPHRLQPYNPIHDYLARRRAANISFAGEFILKDLAPIAELVIIDYPATGMLECLALGQTPLINSAHYRFDPEAKRQLDRVAAIHADHEHFFHSLREALDGRRPNLAATARTEILRNFCLGEEGSLAQWLSLAFPGNDPQTR